MAFRKYKIKERIVMNPIRKLESLLAAVVIHPVEDTTHPRLQLQFMRTQVMVYASTIAPS